ncbi:hypothetical protein IFR04_015907 [Cadophora malorum]|uniref:Uncharacterized protein n=1 Tax=Cadophora malorum TaxID=108018 RepID=A0A8H7T1Y2_9HELO|nr:hypothetical protein IFR04_015907 [Cadophora malorum]
MLAIFALAALGAFTSAVFANTPIDNSVFVNEPLTAVKSAAPLWHFDTKTCFPTAAVQPDGSKTKNLTEDACMILGPLNQGCPAQAKQTQQAQLSTSFPTYYTIRKCDKDASWRVVYDVFFQKDTGHPYDWEWAAVKFVQNADGLYVRDGVWLEQDGNRPYVTWGNIPNTFDGDADKFQNSNKNRDHPKAYFGKWKHHVDVVFNDKFANDCLGAIVNKKDYHSDDYAYYAADNLITGLAVPTSYTYGNADSVPQAFEAGGKYDICGTVFP